MTAAPAKSRKRRPNLTEQVAACLLEMKHEGKPLIPESLRSAPARAIIAAIDWHHVYPHALGGDTCPQNITPIPSPCHDVETSTKTIPDIAKAKRIIPAFQAHKATVARKSGQILYMPPPRPKRPMPGSRASKFKRHMNGMVTRR